MSTRNPLNIGAAARAMSNLGFVRLRVVNPYEASFREARSAVGAASVLAGAQEFKTVAGAVADCSLVVGTTAGRDRELHHPLKLLQEGAMVMRRHLRSGQVALLFGSEKRGLSNADLSHCDWLLHIPTRPEHVSMNLGQAVAVCLYELARGQGMARPEVQRKAAHRREGKRERSAKPVPSPYAAARAGEMERITSLLMDALELSGYLDHRSEANVEKIRRMVRRLDMGARDAEVWQGMLRQIVWKLGKRSGRQ